MTYINHNLIRLAVFSLILVSFLTFVTTAVGTSDDSPQVEWNKVFGGVDDDGAYSIIQAHDEGFVVTGYERSFGDENGDVWVVKLDPSGDILWNTSYGGEGFERGKNLIQSHRDGYVVVGEGEEGMLILKLDSAGQVVWNRTYLEYDADEANSIVRSNDGGYIVAGNDGTLLEINTDGDVLWNRTYPATLYSMSPIRDGYIIAGIHDFDLWLAKIDSSGGVVWNKTYTKYEVGDPTSIVPVEAGGFILAQKGGELLKFNSTGGVVWNRTYGGFGTEVLSLTKGVNDGYVLSVLSSPPEIIKIDSGGNTVWSSGFSWDGGGGASSIESTSDGGYVVAGTAGCLSMESDPWYVKLGDTILTGTGLVTYDNPDMWVVRFGEAANTGDPGQTHGGNCNFLPASTGLGVVGILVILLVIGIAATYRGYVQKE